MSTTLGVKGEERRGRRVLVVEDNEAAGRGLAKVLQAHGYEVTTVADGNSALQALNSPTRADVLLTDLQLPDMDGRDLALHAGQLVPRPRVVLVTGWDVDDQLRDPAASGIDAVMVKPLDIPTLLRVLEEPAPPCDTLGST